MTRSICINLSRPEAVAWAAGAPCLIRPLEPVRKWSSVVHLIDGRKYGTWGVGDVLIGREAWHIDTDTVAEAVAKHEDVMAGAADFGVVFYRADPANENAGCTWRPAATMPAALARHRRRVVSVRVCRAMDLAEHEWRSAGFDSWMDACGATTNIGKGWVSVTMLEPAPGKEGEC